MLIIANLKMNFDSMCNPVERLGCRVAKGHEQ